MRGILLLVTLLLLGCSPDAKEVRQFVTRGELYEEEIEYVREYAQTHGYNEKYCILVDFNRHSGHDRMFVANMEKETIVGAYQGLVAHGSGCGQSEGKPLGFSNVEGSNCSSIGLSVVGRRDYSNWGRNYKYWLRGLTPTNDQMVNRLVVLHGWEGIPYSETYPRTITQSEGCFTVNPDFLDLLDEFIKENRKDGDLLLFAFQ